MGEVGFDGFKALFYGGILFYMILANTDYHSYGECAYVDTIFQCKNVAFLDNPDEPELLLFYRCYDVPSKQLVGCYSLKNPATCLSPSILVDGGPWPDSNEDLYSTYEGQWCAFPDGSNFTFEFPTTAYDETFAGHVAEADELQCRIGYQVSSMGSITVIILLIGLFLDELWGVIDDTAGFSAWSMIRVPMYCCTFSVLILGNILVIATHAIWINNPPQHYMNQGLYQHSDTPCKTPSRIAILLILSSTILLAVEFSEAIYNMCFVKDDDDSHQDKHHH